MHMYMHLYVFINYQQDNCSIFTRWYMTLFRNFALSISRLKLYVENIFLFVFNHWKLKACFDSQYLEYSLSPTFWYFEQMPWSLGHLLFIEGKQLLGISNLPNVLLSQADFKALLKISSLLVKVTINKYVSIHIFFASKFRNRTFSDITYTHTY